MRNQMIVEILEDGKISVKTGEFSDDVHVDADELLALIEEGMGGEVTRVESPEKQRLQAVGAKAADTFLSRKTVKA